VHHRRLFTGSRRQALLETKRNYSLTAQTHHVRFGARVTRSVWPMTLVAAAVARYSIGGGRFYPAYGLPRSKTVTSTLDGRPCGYNDKRRLRKYIANLHVRSCIFCYPSYLLLTLISSTIFISRHSQHINLFSFKCKSLYLA
jgi:hypothetical protein